MDQLANMRASMDRKSEQYAAAMTAISRAQLATPFFDRQVRDVRTLPMIVGVRGSVLYDDAVADLAIFELPKRKVDRVLAAGVRAAISVASEMITGRTVALPNAPPRGRQAFRPRARRQVHWRAERGGCDD
mmetsp:Transcript_3682/g.7442  ORF Transcript_3682/g.7442 Transcript_3682/m.7442 type:complete len:131 (+) Transcript_3682:368-760(+)